MSNRDSKSKKGPGLSDCADEAWKLFKYSRTKARRAEDPAKRSWVLAANRALSLFLRAQKSVELQEIEKRLRVLEKARDRE